MRASFSGWACAALLAAASAASASQAIRLDVERLTTAADQIVVGKVVRVQSRWTSDRKLIVTEVEVVVAERFKGSPTDTVTILQPGGVVEGIGQKVAGMPRFRRGDEVVVFLEDQGGQRFAVTGMAQGKFRVERSSDGRSTFAVPDDLAELGLVDAAPGAPEGTAVRSMPLETLRATVKATLRRSAPTP